MIETAGPRPAARELRPVVAGLIGFAAAEEQAVLWSAPDGEKGTADCWTAAALVAHNTEFRRQQASRLEAITRGEVPPDFAEIDHAAPEVYRSYAAQPAASVAAEAWAVSGALLAGLAGLSDEDLTDPRRLPWLRGRQLWLQLIVRGFWHPAGHLGDYYLSHGQPAAAVELAARAAGAARALRAPAPARGMACYNLACAHAGSGRDDEAVGALGAAIALNPDIKANAGEEPDLAGLRQAGRLAALLGR